MQPKRRVVADALARHIEQFPPQEIEILDATNPHKPFMRAAKLIFLRGRDTAMRRSTWQYPWAKAIHAAGLPDGFDYHGLRHYFATLLIHGGASVKTVQLALGHATPTITLNTYVGLWPDAIDTTQSLVDQELGRRTTEALRRAGV